MSFSFANKGNLISPTVNKGNLSTPDRNDYSKYANAAEDAANRGADRSADRTLSSARQMAQLAQANLGDDFNRSQTVNRQDRDFKASEAGKDRAKSSDEFTQSRYQQNFQNAQNRSDLEYNTRANQENIRSQQQTDLHKQAREAINTNFLNQANIANQQKLAGITQQTALAEQKTSLDRAKEAAKAQVTSALYGSSRQYVGY
jgi:hypothetical protein